jgi:hypothetical protein
VTGAKNWFSSGFAQGKPLGVLGQAGAKPPFADAAKGDYHLAKADAAFVNAGQAVSEIKLPPLPGAPAGAKPDPILAWQYKAPADHEKRPDDGKPDIGAYEWADKGVKTDPPGK